MVVTGKKSGKVQRVRILKGTVCKKATLGPNSKIKRPNPSEPDHFSHLSTAKTSQSLVLLVLVMPPE